MKEKLVKALNLRNLFRMAVAVVAADDDAESQAQAMAAQVDAEVQERLDKSPLVSACAAAGIRSVSDLEIMMDTAKIGTDAVEEARREAKGEAIRAHGAERGLIVAGQVNTADYRTVKMLRDAWRTEADAKHGIASDGTAPERASASSARVALVVEEGGGTEAKTKWEQLRPDQRAFAESAGFAGTPEAREAFAATYLESAGKSEAA